MKKLVLLLFVSGLLLCGCGHRYGEPVEDGQPIFERVNKDIVRHRETGVCYAFCGYNLVPLFNPDGSMYTLKTGGN